MSTNSLTKICCIKTGKLDSNAFDDKGKYPFFTCAPEPLRINEYAFEDDVILLAGNNASGNFHCTRYSGKFNAYQRTYIIKPHANYDIEYVYYALLLQLEVLKKRSAGSQTKFLTMKILNDIQIANISLNEQKTISKSLSLLDKQIERNNNMVQKLQVLSQYIFNRFFAQEKELISLLEFPYSQIIKPGINKFDKQKHYFATAEVDGEILNYKAPLIEYETRESRANMQPVENSVWFAKMKNSIKHIYVSQKDESLINDYIFSTGFCGIKCDDIAFEYLINYLNLPYFEKEKDILSHGATQEGIINEDLKSFKIHLPSKEKLCAFHNKTNGIHCRISEINHVTYQLSYIKEKLLPLLINGQLQ